MGSVSARENVDSTYIGSICAGVVFAFAPYRFCHYMHLELQIVFWIPLALLATHRIIENGSLRDGVMLGLLMAAQLLSSMYMGIFSLVYLAVLIPVLLVVSRVGHTRRLIISISAGALIAGALVTPYALAYRGAEGQVGLRALDDVKMFSASMTHYLSAPAMNRVYGWRAGDYRWADEMNLLPGIFACGLAVLGVLGGQGRARFAYLAGLAISIEMTRGASSAVYLWLFEHVPAFQAFRSPARFDIFVNLSLGVLSAYGVACLLAKIEQRSWKNWRAPRWWRC